MFGSSEHEQFLTECFADQFGSDGGKELHAFISNISTIELPFVLIEQMRRRDFPGFHGFEPGLPSRFYYFVPGSGYGGHNPFPDAPLDAAFVYAVDGVGLNFGCPLRLHLALQVLRSLPPEDQIEARHGLSTSSKHLSTVEELINAALWEYPCSLRRPAATGSKTHDWDVEFDDGTLHVECKYVPASWAMLVEAGDFELMQGSLAGKASKQLPTVISEREINVVAVTGLAPADRALRRLCCNELARHPNVHVIVYSDIVGDVNVFSHSIGLAQIVHSHIHRRPADIFGGFSTIAHFRPEAERRKLARRAAAPPKVATHIERLINLRVEPRPPRRTFYAPPEKWPYRFNLVERLDTGEPVFEWVPPFVLVKD